MLHRFLVTIPAGVEAGMTFAVTIPAAPAAVVANPVATAEAVEAED